MMCAILILGIGLVGLTQGITTALRSSKESELQTTAALLAAGRIETLRADGYVTDGKKEGEWGQALDLYRWKQTITSTAIDGLHEVEVVVENTKSGKAIYDAGHFALRSSCLLHTRSISRAEGSGQIQEERREEAMKAFEASSFFRPGTVRDGDLGLHSDRTRHQRRAHGCDPGERLSLP